VLALLVASTVLLVAMSEAVDVRRVLGSLGWKRLIPLIGLCIGTACAQWFSADAQFYPFVVWNMYSSPTPSAWSLFLSRKVGR